MLIMEKELSEILISYEFLCIAQIDLRPSIHSWECKGKTIRSIFATKSPSEIDKKTSKIHPIQKT